MILGLRYAIRHEPSGLYMPELSGSAGRGYTSLELSEFVALSGPARLFTTKRAASRARRRWLQGEIEAGVGEYPHEWQVTPCPARKEGEVVVAPIAVQPLTRLDP